MAYGSLSTGFQAMGLAPSVTLTKTVARYLKMKLENTMLKKSSLFFCTSFVCNPIYFFYSRLYYTNYKEQTTKLTTYSQIYS